MNDIKNGNVRFNVSLKRRFQNAPELLHAVGIDEIRILWVKI